MEIQIKLVKLNGQMVPMVRTIEQISHADELDSLREQLAHKQKVIDGLQDVILQQQDIKRRQGEEIKGLQDMYRELCRVIAAMAERAAGHYVS